MAIRSEVLVIDVSTRAGDVKMEITLFLLAEFYYYRRKIREESFDCDNVPSALDQSERLLSASVDR